MTVAVAPNNQKMQINKTEEEYNMKSIRFLLLTITLMFLIIGSLMIVLGISVYSHYHSFTFFYMSAKSGHFVTPSVLCVFLGLLLLVVSLFGFFGSLKQSTCMVNMYALFLTLILIMKMVVVILSLTASGDKVLDYIYIPIEEYATDPEIQGEVDLMQTQLGCCGGHSYLDYVGVEFTSNHSTVIVFKEESYGPISVVVPSTCCVNSGEASGGFCTRMWSTGCKAALVNVLVQNATVLGVLGVSVMFINLLGIVFALLLARCIRKMKSQRTMQLWKIREQMIKARETEEQMKIEQNHIYIEQQATSVA